MQPFSMSDCATLIATRRALIVAFVSCCVSGCAHDHVQNSANLLPDLNPIRSDVELLVIDDGNKYAVNPRLGGLAVAVFQDGTIIRSTSFPLCSQSFQTLHVEASVVPALRERFLRLESACRGQQFIGPDMSELQISARNAAAPAEWVRLVFPMYASMEPGKSVIDPDEFLMLRESIDLIKNLNWSESKESSPQDLKRIKNLK